MRKHRNPRQRLSKPPTPDNRRALPEPDFDIAAAFGILQSLMARTDAMTYAVERHFERFGWTCRDEVDDTEDPVDHLAHLIGAARDAALSAKSAGSVIAAELAKRGGVA